MTAMTPFLELPSNGATIDELAAIASSALEAMGVHVDDGRTSSRIDSRTVRFYQTIGVLPKPEYEGRRAIYSITHLLRLVVAKRLQAEGHSLAQIQAALPTRTDAQLWKALEALTSADAPAAIKPAWGAASPAPPAPEYRAPPAYAPPPVSAPAHTQAPAPAPTPRDLRAVELAPGITVVIDPARLAGAALSAASPALDPAALAAAIAHALRTHVGTPTTAPHSPSTTRINPPTNSHRSPSGGRP